MYLDKYLSRCQNYILHGIAGVYRKVLTNYQNEIPLS